MHMVRGLVLYSWQDTLLSNKMFKQQLSQSLTQPRCTNGAPENLMLGVTLRSTIILDKTNGTSGPRIPHFIDAKMASFCSFTPSLLLRGEGSWLFLFILSKIVASHPGGSRKISRRYRNRDKLRPDGLLGSYRLYLLLLLDRNPNIAVFPFRTTRFKRKNWNF